GSSAMLGPAPTVTTTPWPGRRSRVRPIRRASSTPRPTPAAAACSWWPPPRLETVRSPTDLPRRRRMRSPRGRLWLILALVAIFFLIVSLRGLPGFYTDYLWFP